MNPSGRTERSSAVRNGTSMNVSKEPVVGAPNGLSSAVAKSRTTGSTASKADVALVSCSSVPLIPDVGMRRAGCHGSSLNSDLPAIDRRGHHAIARRSVQRRRLPRIGGSNPEGRSAIGSRGRRLAGLRGVGIGRERRRRESTMATPTPPGHHDACRSGPPFAASRVDIHLKRAGVLALEEALPAFYMESEARWQSCAEAFERSAI